MNVIHRTSTWYRKLFVWLVILFPALAVVLELFTLQLAPRSSDGLVVDDYYREGLQINRMLRRDEEAVSAGMDELVALQRQPDGRYLGRHHLHAAGHWYAQIKTSGWRLLQSFWVSTSELQTG